jgi:hypothetical protein
METEMELTLEELDRIEARAKEWGGAFHLDDDETKKIIAAARAHLEGQATLEFNDMPSFHHSWTGDPQPPQQEAPNRWWMGEQKKPQPPQQREDAPNNSAGEKELSRHRVVNDGSADCRGNGFPAPSSPAPSSTVEPSLEQFLDEIEQQPPNDTLKRLMREPSPDTGLVEQWRRARTCAYRDEVPLIMVGDLLVAALEAKDVEIERLKKAYPFHAWSKQKEEAQAEIERLRAEIEHWRSLYRNACKDRSEAQAEIGRKP